MTGAEAAILGLVVERPRHGYDIEQAIVGRHMRDWTEVGFSSIYYVLAKLEKAGLVTSRREAAPRRGPARRVYEATDDGRSAMQRHALEAIAGPAHLPSAFQLGLSTLPLLDPDEVVAAVAAHERNLLDRLARLVERRAAEPPFHVAAMLDLAVTQAEAELAWIRRFAADLQGADRHENHRARRRS